jgi:hypothetical protein
MHHISKNSNHSVPLRGKIQAQRRLGIQGSAFRFHARSAPTEFGPVVLLKSDPQKPSCSRNEPTDWTAFRSRLRPGACGGCLAQVYFEKQHDQLKHAVSLAPNVRPLFGGLLIAQLREGKNGKPFWAYKIRTMPLDNRSSTSHQSADGTKVDVRHLTRWQRFLRKAHIDEFPQLWNVLKGEMSLIGVRPVGVAEAEVTNKRHRRLRAKIKKPGLIGIQYCDPDPGCRHEIMRGERKYLLSHRASPLLTDIRYFAKFLQQRFMKGRTSS